MVTKAEVQSVDYNSNTCTIRIPLFETSSSQQNVVAEATICTPPGVSNGLRTGDIVIISFEDHLADAPVVIGKLFISAEIESKSGGNISCQDLQALNSAVLPINTKFMTSEVNQLNTTESIQNIPDLTTLLKTVLETKKAISEMSESIRDLQVRVKALEDA